MAFSGDALQILQDLGRGIHANIEFTGPDTEAGAAQQYAGDENAEQSGHFSSSSCCLVRGFRGLSLQAAHNQKN